MVLGAGCGLIGVVQRWVWVDWGGSEMDVG